MQMAYYNISYKDQILYGISIKFLHKQKVHRLLLALYYGDTWFESWPGHWPS